MKQLVILCLVMVGYAAAYPGRIVGGQDSSVDKRPYQASLLMRSIIGTYSLRCGASIISTRHLLSAAHCDPGSSISSLYTRVGSSVLGSGGQLLRVASFVTHPSYNSSTLDYDFAVLTLTAGEEITLGPQVQIIGLPSAGQDPEVGSLVTVSGWGVLSEEGGSAASVLQEVDLPVWDNSECSKVYSFVTSRQICLGGTAVGGTSACFGDSGGPVVQGNPLVQYGTVSGGDSCSAANIPGIYGRLSTVRDWINGLTNV